MTRTFEDFSHLPIELRLQIGDLAVHQSLDIKFTMCLSWGIEDAFKLWYTEPATAIPSILHANQESRQVGLQLYIDLFD